MAVTVRSDPDWSDSLANVPTEHWPDLIGQYRWYCKHVVPNDCRNLLQFVTEGERVEWAGFGSREKYIRDGLGLELKAAEWATEGLGIIGTSQPVPFEEAKTAGRVRAMAGLGGVAKLADKGANQHTEGVDNVNSSSGGNSAAYLVAKLKRDAPDIAERLAAGEFRSARAAGIEAGIVKPTPPLTELRRAWRRASDDERAEFLEWINLE